MTNALPRHGVVAQKQASQVAGLRTVAVLDYPGAIDREGFDALRQVPGLRMEWVRSAEALRALGCCDWVVLPGTHSAAADVGWLRTQAMDAALVQHAAAGGPVLGLGGGLQMLCEALIDPDSIEGNVPGLGLLPLVTVAPIHSSGACTPARLGTLDGAWAALSGLSVAGALADPPATLPHPAMARAGVEAREVATGVAWQAAAGNVLGMYVERIFEDRSVLHALGAGQAAGQAGTSAVPPRFGEPFELCPP